MQWWTAPGDVTGDGVEDLGATLLEQIIPNKQPKGEERERERERVGQRGVKEDVKALAEFCTSGLQSWSPPVSVRLPKILNNTQ